MSSICMCLSLHTAVNLWSCRFEVITDKGTMDAVGLMEDAFSNR